MVLAHPASALQNCAGAAGAACHVTGRAAPTIMVLWLSLTEWQPTDNIPWYQAEFAWFWNFYDLLFDERFVNAVLRTLLSSRSAFHSSCAWRWFWRLLFLDEWPWRKVAVSVIILPMMVVPVDAANSFFMLFGDRGPVNELLSLLLHRPVEYAWLADPIWALLPIILAEVWQWTPLMFLLVLTGFMNVPHNQWRAAWRSELLRRAPSSGSSFR